MNLTYVITQCQNDFMMLCSEILGSVKSIKLIYVSSHCSISHFFTILLRIPQGHHAKMSVILLLLVISFINFLSNVYTYYLFQPIFAQLTESFFQTFKECY
jgi:hypothetical protein